MPTHIELRQSAAFDLGFDLGFELDLTLLLTLLLNRIRMWRCQLCGAENGLERFVSEPQASFELFPFFDLHNWAPEGQRLASPFLAYLFWRSKKGM
jgi:hypothetical protein